MPKTLLKKFLFGDFLKKSWKISHESTEKIMKLTKTKNHNRRYASTSHLVAIESARIEVKPSQSSAPKWMSHTQLASNSMDLLFSSADPPKTQNSPFHFWFGSRARYRFSLHFFCVCFFLPFCPKSIACNDRMRMEGTVWQCRVNSIVRVVVVVDRTETTIKT